ncbi:unnamed protein product, partial [Linum tenue]
RQRRCEKKEIGGFQLYPFAIVNCALPRWVSSSILKGLTSATETIVKGVSSGDDKEDLNYEGGRDSFTRGRLRRNQRLEKPNRQRRVN